MSVNEAIERLERVHNIRTKLRPTSLFSEAAVMLREAKELIESMCVGRYDRKELIQRAERWLKE